MVTEQWTMSATPPSAPTLRDAVMHFVTDNRVAGVATEDVRLAVGEAISNAVVHAYVGQPTGPVTVTATAEDSEIGVQVCDRGKGMTPRVDSPGLGLGLLLM